ncbi:uncharacterized protein [Macrobrachium rosenbergii]|uniref:uncharacterized protein n=1 Tax=Macrobrachium rosenbergii TaxID=79674 RepID=UPI0034D707A5
MDRHQLHSREKAIVYKVNRYFQDEKANEGSMLSHKKALARTAAATGFSENTVKRVCSKLNEEWWVGSEHEQPVFSSPKNSRHATVNALDDFDTCVIGRAVLPFYERQEISTLDLIKEELKERISFNGCRESLRKVPMKIGFRFKVADGCKFLLERRDITVARSRFLREMKRRKESRQKFVYLDETWVNQNYTVQKRWTDLSSQQATGVKPPTGKGSRLIILHAGTEDGSVNNAELVFQLRNDGDYHKQMNSEVFEKWFRNQLLPNIPPNCAIAMDNASYHSMQQEKYPTSSWKKENKALVDRE